MVLLSLTALVMMAVPVSLSPATASAAPQEEICKGTGGEWNGKECTNKDASSTNLAGFIKQIINLLLYVLGAIAVLMIIIGGIRYTTSGGDQSGVKGAKDTILYAVIGLVVALMAYAIVNFVILNVK